MSGAPILTKGPHRVPMQVPMRVARSGRGKNVSGGQKVLFEGPRALAQLGGPFGRPLREPFWDFRLNLWRDAFLLEPLARRDAIVHGSHPYVSYVMGGRVGMDEGGSFDLWYLIPTPYIYT